MSCYHPLVGIFDGEYTENGKKKFKIEGALNPFEVKVMHPGSVLIPCGRCIGCRLDYSRAWADRMMLELETAGSAIFVTLTYDNDHITWSHFDEFGNPDAGTLVKRDCQLFMKSLRKRFTGRRIRFYLAGEYGDRTFRPHYHCILFGLSLADFPDLCVHGCNELGQTYYLSDTLASIWSNGFVLLSDVSWRTCAYVSRYTTKKLGYNVLQRDYLNQLPEFALMSRKPGLGADYFELHPDCLDYQSIDLSTPEGGLEVRIPKYYLKKLEDIDPVRYNQMRAQRQVYSEDKMFLELSKTNLGFLDYLEAKENDKLKRISALRRSSV